MIVELLNKNRSVIIEKWIQSVFNTYQQETAKFLNQQKNRFSNPVGHIVTSNIEKIYDEMVNDNDIEKIKLSLNDIIKIRAVQDFSPSQALAFVYSLKEIIFEEVKHEIVDEKKYGELLAIESRIDNIALAGFDLFMDAREKLFQIRIKEVKSKSMLFES